MGYIFDPHQLRDLVGRRMCAPVGSLVTSLIEELAQAYPGHVETRQNWFFNIAGVATGIMTVLHGSLSEYLIIFGTPVGTEGFSGRYWLDIYDIVLAGEMWTYLEGDPYDRSVYRPGDLARLKRRQVKGFRLVEGCWLLEYGRGPVPTALPMGLSGALASLDGGTIWKTLRIYGRLVIRELLRGKI